MNLVERVFDRIGKVFKHLFSAMGLMAMLVGGVVVYFGERCAERLPDTSTEAPQP